MCRYDLLLKSEYSLFGFEMLLLLLTTTTTDDDDDDDDDHIFQKKVSPLMFDNNFEKCGPIFKILSPSDL